MDDREFEERVGPHRRELRAHCYRMLGSWSDAEDLLQEALLRAWRGWDGFEGRASLRSWLYRIATNACLDELERRPKRLLPKDAGPASRPDAAIPAPILDPIWIEPAADEWLDDGAARGPDATISVRESVALAFLSALQLLPAKQRAVLLLREVLGWSSQEVAELLETSVAAVNSALQRARATLDATAPAARPEAPAAGTDERELLGRYVRAWEAADPSLLVSVLRADAALSMPPMPLWLAGAPDVVAFLTGLWAGSGPGGYRLVPAPRANGCPALGVYVRDGTGAYRANGLQVLALRGDGIVTIDTFLDPRLPARMGLAETLA